MEDSGEYEVTVHSSHKRDLEDGGTEICSVVLELKGEKAPNPEFYIVEKDEEGNVWAGQAVRRHGGIDTNRIAKETKKPIPSGLENLFELPISNGQRFDYLGQYLTDVLGVAEPEPKD